MERVSDSITKFIEGDLKLKVNREKTECAYIGRLKFLGYDFYMRDGKCRLRLHEKSEAKLRRKLKQITSRGNTSKGYRRIAGSWILTRAIGDDVLRKDGYSWIGCYYSASALPKSSCRSKRPRSSGGTAVCGTACTVV